MRGAFSKPSIRFIKFTYRCAAKAGSWIWEIRVTSRKKDTAYDTIRAFLNWMISCEKEDRYCDKAMGREHLNQQLREFRTTSYKTKHDRRGRPPKLVKNPTESDGGKEETTNAIENDAAKQKEIGVE